MSQGESGNYRVFIGIYRVSNVYLSDIYEPFIGYQTGIYYTLPVTDLSGDLSSSIKKFRPVLKAVKTTITFTPRSLTWTNEQFDQ